MLVQAPLVRADPSFTSPKGDTLRYCIYGMETEQSQRAPLASGLLLWRFVSGDLSLCCRCVWLSVESQGAWRVQEVECKLTVSVQ